ncbi:MAG: DUF1501 domain-containing protein [Paludibacter sp.]
MYKIKILCITIFLLHLTTINAQQAKSVILIYLDGGPSQTDTFDPKPNASRDIYGNYKNVQQSNVPEIVLGEKFSMLAKIADKFSLIRSMTHGVNGHETGHYAMITGDLSGGSVVYPSFGAAISYKMKDSYKGILPPYISVVGANTRFNEGGFLGNSYKSFDTKGAPEKDIFEVEGLVNTLVPADKFKERMSLLSSFEMLNKYRMHEVDEANVQSLRKQNVELISGKLNEVFNLKNETKEMREKYGVNRLGQSCLVARRLVEAGVPVINVRTTGWDTHKVHFQKMNQMLPELDRALWALLTDLDEKGLLQNTIVMCGGEFGRTPRVLWEAPWNGGRSHFGTAFSYLVAGGGFIPGKVIGKTDATGENILDRKVYPADLIGTVYKLMGIDPLGTLPHSMEGNLPMLPSLNKSGQSNGLLLELIKNK